MRIMFCIIFLCKYCFRIYGPVVPYVEYLPSSAYSLCLWIILQETLGSPAALFGNQEAHKGV